METTKFYDENQPMMTQIRAMERGEVMALPIEKLAVVRSNLSTYGLMLRRKYASHVNREHNCVEVTRVN